MLHGPHIHFCLLKNLLQNRLHHLNLKREDYRIGTDTEVQDFGMNILQLL